MAKLSLEELLLLNPGAPEKPKKPHKSTLQGQFSPKHPEKYLGDPARIIFRSSWELKVFQMCDENPSVLAWASECVKVPYFDAGQQKTRTYFPDLLVRTRVNGLTKHTLIEIKPECETRPPTQSRGKSKATLVNEAFTYATNQSKWRAAKAMCDSRGWEFKVVTEKQIFA